MTENATFGLRTIYSHDSFNRIFSRVRDKFSTKNHRWGGFRRLSRKKYRERHRFHIGFTQTSGHFTKYC